jgi:ribosomal protein L37AE/L43A
VGSLDSASADLAKTYGEENRCPVCGAFARVDRDPELRFVCAVCGAPRIGGKTKPSAETNAALVAAAKAKRSAFAWRVGAWGLGIPAALTLALAAVLAPQSFLAAGVLIAGGVLLAIFAARASRTAATERKKLYAAWTEAWEGAVLTLLGERGDRETTAEEVARALELPASDAEVMLNMLSARSSVRVRVDENDAKLVYEPDSRPVSPLASTTNADPKTAQAEIERALKAQAEAEQAEAEEVPTTEKTKAEP